MFQQFTFENYKSFKEETVLSLAADRADKSLPDNLAPFGKKGKCLKTAAIYGANAAGKSNIFKALMTAVTIIRQSNSLNAGQEMSGIVPFAFDDTSANRPTRFEFVFSCGGVKYDYRFSATKKKIMTEDLFIYQTAKATRVFGRGTYGYKYTAPEFKKQLEPIERVTGENKLFLSTAAAFNCKCVQVPYKWFAQGINCYDANGSDQPCEPVRMFEYEGDSSLHSFTNELLHFADVNIDDLKFTSQLEILQEEAHRLRRQNFTDLLQSPDLDSDSAIPDEITLSEEHMERNQYLADLHSLMNSADDSAKSRELFSVHLIGDGHSAKRYFIPFHAESAGTNKMLLLSPILMRAFSRGETVFIDELDSSIHPLLALRLVCLFNDPKVNTEGAQLVFSAHTPYLLSLDSFRRDQFYFVEKDMQTGSSKLTSLDEYSPRPNENIMRGYLMGRFGAVPDTSVGFAPWGAK